MARRFERNWLETLLMEYPDTNELYVGDETRPCNTCSEATNRFYIGHGWHKGEKVFQCPKCRYAKDKEAEDDAAKEKEQEERHHKNWLKKRNKLWAKRK